MKKLLHILLFLTALPVFGAEPLATADKLWLWEGPVQKYSDYFEFNPSATFALPDFHYGMLGVEYGLSKADKNNHLVQDGEGTNALHLLTKSYQKTNNQAFFGEASFVSDERKNVQWCDVEDRALLNPYLIGDSIGGDYYREAYSMGGGASFHTKNWELGLRGLYKGSVSYRKVDPRPQNTVSTIRVNPGITYFNGPWKLGWYGSYERYRQNVDIQVEKEGRKVYFFLLQGFGIYNRQFSELEESYSRIYKGNMFNTGLHLNYSKSPASKTGMRIAGQRDELEASESDRRTPYKITRNGLNAEFTHQQDILGRTLLIRGSYDLLQTIGNETQYTPSTINTNYIVWNFATQSDRYQSVSEEMGISVALVNQKYWKTSVWGQMEVFRSQLNQDYFTPDYQQSIHDWTASVRIGLHAPMRKSCLDAELHGGIRQVVFSDLYQGENTVLAERLTLPDFAYLSSDRTFYEVKLKYGYGLISTTLQGGLQLNGEKQSYFAQAGLALNF
jgi:hypothetical protein